MSDIAIRIEHVSKEYRLGAIGGTTLREEMQLLGDKLFHRIPDNPDMGKRFLALDDINLEVKKGERLGIIGHNGAGKSTLLKLLARVTAPTTGTISYNGRISSMLEVGTGFHKELTGRENIYMNGAILGMNKREIDSKIDSIIEFAEMAQFIDTPVKRYSSGMYVKLAFSVAAHLDSEIMIMDEVLAVGDMNFQRKCIDKMNEVSQQDGRTILYVSHNMNTIRMLCQRCVVLEHGKVVQDGDVELGITKYLNRFDDDYKTDIDCSKKKHIQGSNATAVIDRIQVQEKTEPRFTHNEQMVLKLTMTVQAPIRAARFRLTLRTRENIPVGTFFSEPYDFNRKGKLQALLYVPLSELGIGEYYITVAVITIDEKGKMCFVDHITSAFQFFVEDDLKNKFINWTPHTLGFTRFPIIKAELLE